MAQHAIVSKLQQLLAVGIRSEAETVYLCVELRKLMEQTNTKEKFPALKFACDWVVHTELNGPEAQGIVRLFNNYEELQQAPEDTSSVTGNTEFLKRLKGTTSLTIIRGELSDFLSHLQLPSQLADDTITWLKFLKYYSQVIEDSPLKCKSQNLQFTEEVNVCVIDIRWEAESEYTIMLDWAWKKKKDGTEAHMPQFF